MFAPVRHGFHVSDEHLDVSWSANFLSVSITYLFLCSAFMNNLKTFGSQTHGGFLLSAPLNLIKHCVNPSVGCLPLLPPPSCSLQRHVTRRPHMARACERERAWNHAKQTLCSPLPAPLCLSAESVSCLTLGLLGFISPSLKTLSCKVSF